MPRQKVTSKKKPGTRTRRTGGLKGVAKKRIQSTRVRRVKKVKVPEEFIVKDYKLLQPHRMFEIGKVLEKFKILVNVKKMALRILTAFLVVAINFSGVSFFAQAFFSDLESTSEAGFGVASLDFVLRSDSQNFVPVSVAEGLVPGDQVSRNIFVSKQGEADFKYRASSFLTSGDIDLYNALFLKVWYNWYEDIPTAPDYIDHKNKDLKYAGLLVNFVDFDTQPDDDLMIDNSKIYYSNPFYQTDEHWLEFQISLPAGAESNLQNKSVEFGFDFDSLQVEDGGFEDRESMMNILSSGNWGVVLNEFLPNPEGSDVGTTGLPLDGEWVELYNNGSGAVDVDGWVIYDNDDSHELYITSQNTNTGSTVIPGHGWLVVYRDGDGDFNLNNDADAVRLYDGYPAGESNQIDAYVYTTEKPEGYSYARIPDGVGEWVDPVPTPGGSNLTQENRELLNSGKEGLAINEQEDLFGGLDPIEGQTIYEYFGDMCATSSATTSCVMNNEMGLGWVTSTQTTTSQLGCDEQVESEETETERELEPENIEDKMEDAGLDVSKEEDLNNADEENIQKQDLKPEEGSNNAEEVQVDVA